MLQRAVRLTLEHAVGVLSLPLRGNRLRKAPVLDNPEVFPAGTGQLFRRRAVDVLLHPSTPSAVHGWCCGTLPVWDARILRSGPGLRGEVIALASSADSYVGSFAPETSPVKRASSDRSIAGEKPTSHY